MDIEICSSQRNVLIGLNLLIFNCHIYFHCCFDVFPFIHFLCPLYQIGGHRRLRPILGVIGPEVVYTLDRSPVHHRDAQPCTQILFSIFIFQYIFISMHIVWQAAVY